MMPLTIYGNWQPKSLHIVYSLVMEYATDGDLYAEIINYQKMNT